jgi:hypothetical protein
MHCTCYNVNLEHRHRYAVDLFHILQLQQQEFRSGNLLILFCALFFDSLIHIKHETILKVQLQDIAFCTGCSVNTWTIYIRRIIHSSEEAFLTCDQTDSIDHTYTVSVLTGTATSDHMLAWKTSFLEL